MSFEPFDTFAFANHKFRDSDKKKWQNKRGFTPSGTAPAMKQSQRLMNQTGTDQPYNDGFKVLGHSHYRKRSLDKELSSV